MLWNKINRNWIRKGGSRNATVTLCPKWHKNRGRKRETNRKIQLKDPSCQMVSCTSVSTVPLLGSLLLLRHNEAPLRFFNRQLKWINWRRRKQTSIRLFSFSHFSLITCCSSVRRIKRSSVPVCSFNRFVSRGCGRRGNQTIARCLTPILENCPARQMCSCHKSHADDGYLVCFFSLCYTEAMAPVLSDRWGL